MINRTKAIYQLIDSFLSKILTFNTSGFELYIIENNPKTPYALLKDLKVFHKSKSYIDPHEIASQIQTIIYNNSFSKLSITYLIPISNGILGIKPVSFTNVFKSTHELGILSIL